MKKLILVLILQLYNTPQISAQPDTLYDVFPLAKWNQYNYNYHFSDTLLYFGTVEYAQNDSGIVSYLIIDSTLINNKVEWLVERSISLQRHIVRVNWGGQDTTYLVQQTDQFILTESLNGYHELMANAPLINFGSVDNWSFPARGQVPIYRYSMTTDVIIDNYSSVRNFDSLYFNSSKGLYKRKYYYSDSANHIWIDKTNVDLIGDIVGIEQNELIIPAKKQLSQNYPNPFNPSTKISWQAPVSGWQTLKVYDVLGNEVATLVNEYKNAGSYEVEFNEASNIKNPASGIYFYRLQAGDYLETKKMILLK